MPEASNCGASGDLVSLDEDCGSSAGCSVGSGSSRSAKIERRGTAASLRAHLDLAPNSGSGVVWCCFERGAAASRGGKLKEGDRLSRLWDW